MFNNYYLIYFFSVIFSFLGLFCNYKPLKFLTFFLITYILVLYAGLRIPSGGDWYNYVSVFHQIHNFSEIFNYNNYSKEPLYLFFNLVIKYISNNYFVFFTIIALSSITLNFLSYKRYTKYYFVSIILYVSFFFYFREMGAIRAGLAYAIILYSLKYIKNKSFFKFIILNFIALGFHYTVILAFFLYPLYYSINWNKKKFIIIITLAIVLNLLHLSNFILHLLPQNNSFIIFNKIMNYQKDKSLFYSLGFDFTNIKNLILVTFFLIFYNLLSNKIKYFNIIFFVYFVGAIFRIFFADFGVLAARSATMFLTVEPILISYVLYLIANKYLKLLVIIMIIFYSFFQLYFSFHKYKINFFENYIFSSYTISYKGLYK